MHSKTKWLTSLILAILVGLFAMTACGPSSAARPTTTISTTTLAQTTVQTARESALATLPPEPTAATVSPTNTKAPTATSPLPTATIQPSATPALALLQDGFSGWCLPEKMLVSAAKDPLNPPKQAQIGEMIDDALEIRNMPFSICIFLYTFNQPAPAGLKLEIYDKNLKTPWLKTDLTPVDGKTDKVFARLRHSYIINPPLWNVSYTLVVRDSSGTELQRNKVNLHRWKTGLCWQGTYPDPNTLYCPLQQDLHPWDPGFGKKLPTVTPRP
jgi:hypothetical protein